MSKKDNNHTIGALIQFRIEVEAEAKTSIANIPTTLGLALADITEILGIWEPEDMLKILGPDAYLAVYWDPIPYRPAHPPLHKVHLLLAKLRDTWRGRWGKPKTETPPLPA